MEKHKPARKDILEVFIQFKLFHILSKTTSLPSDKPYYDFKNDFQISRQNLKLEYQCYHVSIDLILIQT